MWYTILGKDGYGVKKLGFWSAEGDYYSWGKNAHQILEGKPFSS
ncbi:MAG: hypothetical protein XD50_0579 [Clostridia bacterium 41_269]|nr:MAG: hypothetical protein XD50_0579 [Clostridia bacterium 41_269]